MPAAKLKAGLWIKAQVRICDLHCIPVAILHKGDADAGAILIKLRQGAGDWAVFAQIRTLEGALGWMRGTGPEPVPEADAEAYLRRQLDRDPDVWVIEIDDRDGRYNLDGDLVT